MRRLLLIAALVLCAGAAWAQPPGIWWSGGSSGSGSADPSQFSSPAGTLTIGGAVGAVTIDADTSVIPTYATGTSLPATCTPFATSFLDTDSTTTLAYDCIATNTWAGRFTIADDSVLVGTGTTTASKAIPDCDDSAGQHLNYDTATNAFSCGTSGSSSFDPSTTLDLYEECASGTTTAGQIGNLGLTFTAYGTGTAGANVAVGDTPMHPGLCYTLAHATNDDSGGALVFTNAAAASSFGYAFGSNGSGAWALDFVVLTPASLTDRALYVGLFGTGGPTYAALVAARFDTDRSDTTWGFVICDSTTSGCQSNGDDTNQNYVASSITPSAATAYRVRIDKCVSCGPAGVEQISMRINNETAKTFCSSGCNDTLGNRPGATTGLVPGVAFFTRAANTTAITMGQLDYGRVTITGLSRY